MDETERFEEIFDMLCKTAVDIFHSKDEVAPFIFIFPGEGKDVPVIPITGDKEAVSQLVQDTCRKVGAIAGAVVSEAWSTKLEKGVRWDGTPPSERLDREEILIVLFQSKLFNRIRSWKIVRRGKDKSLEDYESPFDAFQTRFFGDYFRVDA